MSWKKLLESVSESLNDHLRLRNDYLMAENRILRHQIDGRMRLTDSERKELAGLGAQLGKKALTEIATITTPDTILAWHRKFAAQQADTSLPPKSVGRPRVAKEIEDLVIRMARENRSWGYDRIQGALKNLGYTISDQTVGNILKRHSISPAPERKKTVTWREFVRIHRDVLRATDFFNHEVWSWFELLIASLLGCFHFGRYQSHAVDRALHQHMKGIRSLLLPSLTLTAYWLRWIHIIEKLVSSRMMRWGESLPRRITSAFTRSHERYPNFQDIGKVVFLSVAYPRQIRAGPSRHRQRFHRSPHFNYREAA
jgi:putative transposase